MQMCNFGDEKNILNVRHSYSETNLNGKKDGRYLYTYSVTNKDYLNAMNSDSLK